MIFFLFKATPNVGNMLDTFVTDEKGKTVLFCQLSSTVYAINVIPVDCEAKKSSFILICEEEELLEEK